MPKLEYYKNEKMDNEIIQFLGEMGYETFSCLIRCELEEKEFGYDEICKSIFKTRSKSVSADVQRISRGILEKI